ncbi:hypothetical protein CC2G_014181 [Coprinopsis cinerea AmutBmut pab1-1]|nr:hypothetical protein CC2G_014181 [Coprinopsis cinerea AmutBmut pab1-1]
MTSSSHVLILGSNSIHSLVPSSLITQVESLLDSHKLEDAFTVADTRRKKLEESIEVDEDQAEELRYVFQRIGFQYFSETMFEDAGKLLFNGQLDPRVLVSYFPQLRGNLFSDEDHVDVFAGIAEKMPREASVDDIIRNYSPHLSPNTQSAPTTAELRKILQERALEMLETFLKKERRRRMALDLDKDEEVEQFNNSASSKGKERERPRSIRAIIDTVLAKIYAQSEKTSELYDLLSSPNSIVLSEVEDVFRETGQYNALCMLYQLGGPENDEKLLEVWSKIVDGVWTDPDIPDPLLQMVSLLMDKRDKALTHKWGIWLLKRDQEAAIRLLTALRDTGGKRRDRERTATGEDLALLEQIELESPAAAKQYLEYLVLQKRSQSKELHNRLALSCIDAVLQFLRQDDAISKLWRAKVSSYTSTSSKAPKATPLSPTTASAPPALPSFFSYFESTTPESPSKRARLCSVLFLSGSHLYDPEMIKARIVSEKREKILSLEMALLEGKLGNHRSALTTLACELSDAASAEAYCTLQGDVIPPKVAISAAEAAGLDQWAEGLFLGGSTSKSQSGKAKPAPALIQRPIDDAKKKELLKVLLEVYMLDDSPTSAERASQLLNAQAMNLDVLDVLELVPPSWPLPSLTPFLARSFRRITHLKREGQIAKNIASGQNLEVKERTWEPVRLAGALVEEELDDGDDDESGGVFDEKRGLGEKDVVAIVSHDSTANALGLSEKGSNGIGSGEVVADDLR